jgi:hypothetical protein
VKTYTTLSIDIVWANCDRLPNLHCGTGSTVRSLGYRLFTTRTPSHYGKATWLVFATALAFALAFGLLAAGAHTYERPLHVVSRM